MERSRIR
ncbi:hypothetical protein D030_3886A, partial [Vibrio parahaemolyticus AQ3810]